VSCDLRALLRQMPPETFQELIALLDRFIGANLNYELEWDDFISWRNHNPNIEKIRERIAKTEPLFFSKNPFDRELAVKLLVDERNGAAAIIGLEARNGIHSDTILARKQNEQ
jgi:hypothetical protein